MRFSLQDVKRQVRRRDDELTVAFHFLRPGELRAEIELLIAYHERCRGQKRKDFNQDEASACIGDYRLAHCLLITLSAWYTWQQPAWTERLQTLSEEARTALAESAITSPVQLRLALFDYVNEHYHGFLDEQTRPVALDIFATIYGLEAEQLAELLILDTEDESLLTRLSHEPPDVEAVAARYNQWVFEAALFNSSEVHLLIDGEAFLQAQQTTSAGENAAGLGAVVKRLCFLARKLGVYYDLAYEEMPMGQRATLLHLTLYGPQDMTGTPQQYGLRVARLCRLLLGYGVASSKRAANTALHKAIRQAEATVHIFQQSYRFLMDAELLALLPAPERESESGRVAEPNALYDSSIEQSFAEAFGALARSQGVAGWRLEREPEPLLFPQGADTSSGIFIPDFALTRGSRRIYVEILGFWTPAYRERKLQKLQYLRERTDLILALPHEARQVFAGLAEDFPLVVYRGQLSATEVLRVLQARYDDFEQRLADLASAEVQNQLRAVRFLPERDCYALLRCYRRSELARAAERVLAADMTYTPGLGLYLLDWLEHLHRSFVEWIEAEAQVELLLAAVIQHCRTAWPELASCDESVIETLLSLWPEVRVQRESIFEAKLLIMARQHERTRADEAILPTTGGKRTPRERRAAGKKQQQQQGAQQHLWE